MAYTYHAAIEVLQDFLSTGTTTFKLSAGKGLITLEENYYPSWDMLVAELEK